MAHPRKLGPQATYVLLKTKTTVTNADDPFELLYDAFPYNLMNRRLAYNEEYKVPLFAFDNDGTTWENGIALRFMSIHSSKEIIKAFDGSLDEFESWAIYRSSGDFEEPLAEGLVSRFFNLEFQNNNIAKCFASIFISDDNSRKVEQVITEIKNPVAPVCLPIFYLDCGAVILHDTKENANMIKMRFTSSLSKIKYWAIEDLDGNCVSSCRGNNSIWDLTDLYDLVGYYDD